MGCLSIGYITIVIVVVVVVLVEGSVVNLNELVLDSDGIQARPSVPG